MSRKAPHSASLHTQGSSLSPSLQKQLLKGKSLWGACEAERSPASRCAPSRHRLIRNGSGEKRALLLLCTSHHSRCVVSSGPLESLSHPMRQVSRPFYRRESEALRKNEACQRFDGDSGMPMVCL